MIYLDYNATTPVDKNVLESMLPYFCNQYGNPSNTYGLGYDAKMAVEKARQQISDLIGVHPHEIVFTSCGSESNNMLIKGVVYKYKNKGRHIITSMIEHPAVLNTMHFLEKNGFDITYLPVDHTGKVQVTDFQKSLRKETILVSIMHSNNEVGTLQPIQEIGNICKEKGIIFHTDASQSLGKVNINCNELNIDALTIAGHKMYAPKGIGALYIKDGIQIEPLIHGASQELGHRAGTENVPYIVGLGQAAEIAKEHLQTSHLSDIRYYFYEQLVSSFDCQINTDLKNSLPNTLNVNFIGQSGNQILSQIPDICASTGSACHSSLKDKPSSILLAMGINEDMALGAIRWSVGRYTTKDDIDYVIQRLKEII